MRGNHFALICLAFLTLGIFGLNLSAQEQTQKKTKPAKKDVEAKPSDAQKQSDPKETIRSFLSAMEAGNTEEAAKLMAPVRAYKTAKKKTDKKDKGIDKKQIAAAQKAFKALEGQTIVEPKQNRITISLSNNRRAYLIKVDGKWLISSATAPKTRKEFKAKPLAAKKAKKARPKIKKNEEAVEELF